MAPVHYNAFTFLLISWCICIANGDRHPEITIAQGVVRGKYTKTFYKREIASFEGIPYAKPPVGHLRFKEPIPADPWTGTYKANKLPSMCFQYDVFSLGQPQISGSEDCLYLNVYTPQLPSKDQTKLLDVIAFIHGGAFTMGRSWDHGPSVLLDRDVVLVTFNYRIGPFGFLSTEDSIVPGNNGLKDQVLALKWIQQNIAAFGGNPKSVTLGGLSAGGASCSYHLLSPLSKGLFKGALCLSGVAANPWAMTKNARERAKIIAAGVDCPTEDSLPMIDCLRDRPAEKILENIKNIMYKNNIPLSPFAPVIEPVSKNAFISESPISIIKNKKGSDVPVVFSFVSHEGAFFLSNPLILDFFEHLWDETAPLLLEYNHTVPDKRPVINERIKEFYKFESEPTNAIYQYVKVLGDRMFSSGLSKLVKASAAHYTSPVYSYKFSYKGKVSIFDILSLVGRVIKNKELVNLPTHADDSLYTLGLSILNNLNTEDGRKLTKQMQDMWVSFAANGTLGQNWQPVQESLPKIVFTDIKGPDGFVLTEVDEFGEESFWDSLGIDDNMESQVGTHAEL